MDLPFELHVALRYLLAKRKQAFISVISLISTLGVTVGVMALVIALALMTGLQQELRDRILGSQPAHLRLEDRRHRRLPRRGRQAAAAAARRRRGAGDPRPGADLGAARDAAVHQIKGIDPALEPQVTDIRRAMQSGSLDALDDAGRRAAGGILLGKDLAAQARRRRRRLGVGADAAGHAVADGHACRGTRRLRVAGIFSLGLYEFDSTYGFVSLDVAKRLLGKDRSTASSCASTTSIAAPQIARSITDAARRRVRRRRTGPT